MLFIVVTVVVLVVAIPLVPVDVHLSAERDLGFSYRVGVRWLFGLVGLSINGAGAHDERTAETPAERPAAEASKPGGGVHVLDMLRAKGFVSGVTALVRRIVGAVELRSFSLRLRAGFEDPADTGRMSGWLLPLSAALGARYPGRLDLAPEFGRETLSFNLGGDVRIVPARVVWPILSFGMSPSTWRGLRALRAGARR